MNNKKFLNSIENYVAYNYEDMFAESIKTRLETIEINGKIYNQYINAFWTEKQRQSNNIHEVSYRGCYKPELPNFFISKLTEIGDIVFDPFSGRGTTIIEASLMNRNIVANDINPLSRILAEPRINPPTLKDVKDRLASINFNLNINSEIDLSMFFQIDTLQEILTFREVLTNSRVDKWIKMVATNRLTGHSAGFFSVYTLPPNQAVTQERQVKLNKKNGNTPEYRDTKRAILKKSETLLADINDSLYKQLHDIYQKATFLTSSATKLDLQDSYINLTITSPPFLDVIDYNSDNWLRNWFNKIDEPELANFSKLEDWKEFIYKTMVEIYRVTKTGGYFIFEVGEVKNGQILLDEVSIPLGEKAGFECIAILINKQEFTKTANIWNIDNNSKGTNSNRILIFRKG